MRKVEVWYISTNASICLTIIMVKLMLLLTVLNILTLGTSHVRKI